MTTTDPFDPNNWRLENIPDSITWPIRTNLTWEETQWRNHLRQQGQAIANRTRQIVYLIQYQGHDTLTMLPQAFPQNHIHKLQTFMPSTTVSSSRSWLAGKPQCGGKEV